MHDVDPLPIGGERAKTRVWITKHAAEGLDDYFEAEQPSGAFLKRLNRYALNGFGNYEGGGGAIRHEGDGVYRIAEGLFRLIGFYVADAKTGLDDKGRFVVIDAIRKRGQKLNAADRDAVAAVAKVKASGDWQVRKPADEQPDEGDRQADGTAGGVREDA